MFIAITSLVPLGIRPAGLEDFLDAADKSALAVALTVINLTLATITMLKGKVPTGLPRRPYRKRPARAYVATVVDAWVLDQDSPGRRARTTAAVGVNATPRQLVGLVRVNLELCRRHVGGTSLVSYRV
ncbi:hypothetical protein CLV30_10150 [Haloactinopolyspora alba]|uniref:Uncharacterized protein n=1 Tax=Haloactinopolyspora alba TaxID=648780 RepID=A0A2P8EF42_9ACTN|nr:hypothetical protein [Haloactinopolyspora alba]PSL08083.1 hypothetical protein CLV30_10150 [Haloactinopolyspora alba]